MCDFLNNLSISQYESNYITNEMVCKSYYGDYTHYSQQNYSNIAGEIALWRGVLLQQFVNLKIKSNNKKYNKRKREAYKWFMLKENEKDVKQICEYAEYSYVKVMKLANQIIDKSEYLQKIKKQHQSNILH